MGYKMSTVLKTAGMSRTDRVGGKLEVDNQYRGQALLRW